MDQDKYKYIMENLEGAFSKLLHKLTEEKRNTGGQIIIEMHQVFTAYFELLKYVKVAHMLFPCHIQEIVQYHLLEKKHVLCICNALFD